MIDKISPNPSLPKGGIMRVQHSNIENKITYSQNFWLDNKLD
jgi:hypothetical protein